jgi:hypothetical protein
MSAAEINYRLHEAIKRRRDSASSEQLVPAAQDFGLLPIIPDLRARLMASEIDPALLNTWHDCAAKMERGNFQLLGQQWPDHASADRWHLDPATGKCWPRDPFCFSINYRHADGWGDIKLVWEINRLQHVQAAAALACVTRDHDSARACLAEVEHWIDLNPPFRGINWNSGIELALRVVSFLVVFSFVGEAATQNQRLKFWNTLHVHGVWLSRYISAYSSANNHRTAEGLGLLLIGSLCPIFVESSRWRSLGQNLLEETASLQILADGVGAEQATAYTAVVAEMLLLGNHVAAACGHPMSQQFLERLALAGEYLRWFIDDRGNVVHIGDDDNACVIGPFHPEQNYVGSVLNSLANVVRRPDLLVPGAPEHLRDILFGRDLVRGEGPQGMRTFSTGGYTVGRHKTDHGDLLVAFDHGYLGYLSIAAHGHADALSLWLHCGGQPVFVDAGTYLYHSGGEWRRYFRETRSHNTLAVEGRSSSSISGHFNWSHKASAALIQSEENGDCWFVEAEHDGYKPAFGCLHRRRLAVDPARGLTVSDRLLGGNPVDVEIGYMLHPDLTASLDSDVVSVRRGDTVLIRVWGEGNLALSLRVPGENSVEAAWYSSSFGRKVETTRISFKGMLSEGRDFITHIEFVRPLANQIH